MSLFGQILVNAADFTASVQDSDVEAGARELRDTLQAQPELRLYVDAAPGYGHQAASINILLRLMFGFAYGQQANQRVTIVYRTQYAGQQPAVRTVDKLATLLPGVVAPADQTQVPAPVYVGPGAGNPNVFFLRYEDEQARSQLPEIQLGFSGGADPITGGTVPNLAELLHVRSFLVLQPYQFTSSPSYAAYRNAGAYHYETFNWRFGWLNEFIFYQPTLPPADVPWQWFEQHGANAKGVRVVRQTIARLSDTLHLSATYSIDENRVAGLAPQSIATIFAAGLAQSNTNSVVVNFGTMTEASVDAMDQLIDGGMTPFERWRADLVREDVDDAEDDGDDVTALRNLLIQYVQAHTLRFQFLQTLDLADRCRLRHVDRMDEHLNELTADLNWAAAGTAGQPRVLFLQVGPVPPVIFRQAIERSTQPMVCEGPNTAQQAMNAGTAYLHMMRMFGTQPQNPAYPLLNDPDGEFAAAITQARTAAACLTHGFDIDWTNAGTPDVRIFETATGELARFADANRDPESEIRDYFDFIGDDLASVPNDRFVRGALILFDYFRFPEPEQLRLAADHEDLQQLLERLQGQLQDGRLALLPDGLPDNRLRKQYVALMEHLQQRPPARLDIDGATLTPQQDQAGKLVGIELTGSTDALGLPLEFQLELTETPGTVHSVATFRLARTWNLDAAPWISLESAGLKLHVDEGSTPLRGEIVGRVGGAKPFDLSLAFPAPTGATLVAIFDPDNRPEIRDIYALVGGLNLSGLLPDMADIAGAFGVDRLAIGYDPKAGTLQRIDAAISASESWSVAGLSIGGLAATIQVQNPGDPSRRSLQGELRGTLTVAEDPPVVVGLTARLPGLLVEGRVETGELTLAALAARLLPGVSFPTEAALTDFAFTVDLRRHSYALHTNLATDWQLSFDGVKGVIRLDNLQLQAGVGTPGYAFLAGSFLLGDPAGEHTTVSLAARYAGGWQFIGEQTGPEISLRTLAEQFLPSGQQLAAANADADPSDIRVAGLKVVIDPATHQYTFSARISWQPFANMDPFQAAIRVARQQAGEAEAQFVGEITAATRLLGADVELALRFADSTEVMVRLWQQEAAYADGVITFHFTGFSLGDLLARLTSWVTANRRPVALPAPWNLLNDITLDQFEFVFDTRNKTFSITYHLPRSLNLGVFSLDGIGLSAGGDQAGNAVGGLKLALLGDRLPEKSSWDATDPGDAPDVPGISDAFELRLLALGQHVAVADQQSIRSVPDAIERLGSLGPAQGDQLPVSADGEGRYPRFDPNMNWLVAADFGLLAIGREQQRALRESLGDAAPRHLLELAFVFIDPELYGIRIAIDKQANILAGLQFEILYKKLSDTLGVYEIELELPVAVRTLDVGALSVTMPLLSLDIYSNGDFLLDLGYPHDQDFSRSFVIQGIIPPAIPVLGGGGLYFGMLSGGSCDRLPKTVSGTFSPVTAFGLGFQVGLGRRFDKGILKAEISLTILAFLEGVVARYNPSNEGALLDVRANGMDGDHYYWLRGTFGLQGKLYGSVDFKLVKARVDAGFQALVTATYEIYRPTVLDVSAGVAVAASIRVNLGLFSIRIRYSFSARISEQITLGKAEAAPWDDARALPAAVQPAEAQVLPVWTPVPAEEPVELTLHFAPTLTIVRDDDGGLADQHAAYVAMLYMDAGSAEPAAEALSSFESFCVELLRFLVSSIHVGRGAAPLRATIDELDVTRQALEDLYRWLTDPAEPSPLPYAEIERFLTSHFRFVISSPDSAQAEGELEACVFPMLPALGLEVDPGSGEPVREVSFAHFGPVTGAYLERIQKIFEALEMQVQGSLDPDHAATSPARDDGLPTPPSMATVVLEDFVNLCARHVVQAATDAIDNYQYPLPPGANLSSVIDWAGTVNALDPGALLEANAALPLSIGRQWTVPGYDPAKPDEPGLRYSATQEDSLRSIAARFAAGEAVAGFCGELLLHNAATPQLLAADVSVTLGDKAYTTRPGDTWQMLADALETDLAALAADATVADSVALIQRLAVWNVPTIQCTTDAEKLTTLGRIADFYGLPVTALARPTDNLNMPDPFRDQAGDPPTTVTLSLPAVRALPLSSLAAELHHSQSLLHLAGMASRFALHGLRLPLPEGVEADTEDLPLYALTGQQFLLPEELSSLAVTLTRPADATWLTFAGTGDPARLPVNIDDAERKRIAAVRAFARAQGLVPAVEALGPAPVYQDAPAGYPFREQIPWQSGGQIRLPRETGDAPDALSLRIWPVPPGLARLIDRGRAALRPRLGIDIATRDAASGVMRNRTAAASGWATLVDVEVRQLSDAADSAAAGTCYELLGTTADGTDLLRDLLLDDAPGIHGLTLLYRASAAAERSDGLVSEGYNDVAFFITRINLSTRTNPDALPAAAAATGPAWNGAVDFVRRLWNASVTRSGGYYLYYRNQTTGTGLPERIFDDHGKARLSLLVTYTATDDQPGDLLAPYVNAAVTGDTLDDQQAAVYGQVVTQPQTHSAAAGESLAAIAARFRVRLGVLAERNASVALAADATVQIDPFFYEVRPPGRPPGGNLTDIAEYFRVDPQQVRELNPHIDDPSRIPTYTLLRMPSTTVNLADATGLATLADCAARYGIDYDALAWANRDNDTLLAVDSTLAFPGGATSRAATAPMGAASLVLERTMPPETPADPNQDDYAALYLQNLFDLLGYRVCDNPAFTPSPPGLPIGPTVDTAPDMLESRRQALPQRFGDEAGGWKYRHTLPASRFAKPRDADPGSGLPPADGDPYAGVGDAVQLELAWLDAFGNRMVTPLSDPELDPQQPLNRPPLPLGFTDKLVAFPSWPAAALAYRIDGGNGDGASLSIEVSLDATRYAADPALNRPSRFLADLPQWQENARKDRLVYATICYQLFHLDRDGNASLGIALTTSLRQAPYRRQPLDAADMGAVREWAAAVYAFLDARARGDDAHWQGGVLEIRQPLPLDQLETQALFGIDVSLRYARDVALVHPAFRGDPEVCEVDCAVPAATRGEGAEQSLADFARGFEQAFRTDHFQLKLATGIAAGADRPGLFAVRFGDDPATGIRIRAGAHPTFLAPRPLATRLENRPQACIHDYVPGQGIDWSGAGRSVAVNAVDLDAWAREFLTDFDRYLAPPVSTPTFIVDRLVEGASYLDRLLAAKERLAGVLSRQLGPVLKNQSVAPDSLAAARESVRQQLLIRLGEAYSIDAVAQYPFSVDSPLGTDGIRIAPRLRGALTNKAVNDSPGKAFTLLPGPLSLERSTEQHPNELSVMLRTHCPLERPALPLDLEFRVSHLEHGIRREPALGDYEASSWLAFVIPPAATDSVLKIDLGPEALMPVPLRAYPTPPTLAEQGFIQPDEPARDVRDTGRWSYRFRYRVKHTQRDVIDATAYFGVDLTTNAGADDVGRDLVVDLLQYRLVRDAMHTDLQTLLDKVAGAADADAAAHACVPLEALATLIEHVVEAWAQRVDGLERQLSLGFTARETLPFRIEEDADPRNDGALVVHVQTDASVANPPRVDIPGYTTEPDKRRVGLYRYRKEGSKGRYLSYADALDLPVRDVVIDNLDVVEQQNAWSSVAVVRNDELIEDSPSREAFVYRTDPVSFANPLNPLLTCEQAFDIARIGPNPGVRRIADHMAALGNALLRTGTTSTIRLKLGCECRYRINGAVPETALPVLFIPDYVLAREWGSEHDVVMFSQNLEEALGAWRLHNPVKAPDARFHFSLWLIAQNSSAPQPLLTLPNLVLYLRDIEVPGPA